MKNTLSNYFHFTRGERMGAIVLLVACLLIFIAPEFLFRKTAPELQAEQNTPVAAPLATPAVVSEIKHFDPNTATLNNFLSLGLSEKTARTILKYREKGGHFRSPADFRKIWGLNESDIGRLEPMIQIGAPAQKEEAEKTEAALFEFDPNTATEDQFTALGLKPHTIQSILRYREKGGQFRSKKDLSKIYTLPAETFERLEPFIVIGANAARAPKSYTSSTVQVDINTADVMTLTQLPGIGEKRAAQIVKFRDALGGFRQIEQLAEIYNLPDSVYQRLKTNAILSADGMHRININTATAEELNRHPYISGKQADLIVAYRAQHGAFKTVSDLSKIQAFKEPLWLEKVLPYLAVE